MEHLNDRSNGVLMEPPAQPTEPPANTQQNKPRFGWHYLLLVVLVAGIVVAVVLHRQARAQGALEKMTEDLAVSTVLAVHPEREPGDMRLVLPGNVLAFKESTIYARVSGYLKRWLVDIGTQVKEGQLLAEIDTPETDQQLNQARAVLLQTEADVKLAQITAERWKKLLKDNAVSQQEADEKSSALEVRKADLAAAQANVSRLEELQSFKKVTAPFDGVIVSRKTEVGNLINAGSGGADKELFQIAQTNTLRVFTSVPEAYSSFVTVGTKARIEMATAPGAFITGQVARTSGAIDPASNTMLVQIDVPNSDGKLLPGGYASVHLDLAMDRQPLLIPANTLIFRASGAQVAVVDAKGGAVKLVKIKIGRDFGAKLEVISGLEETDSVIVNPSDSLRDGDKVRVSEGKVGEKKS
jgi:membrane fusion protein, multidrug efflux system